MNGNSELLVGLSVGELEALADGLLAPAAQARLSDLLARKREQQLAAGEETELDRLLRSAGAGAVPDFLGQAGQLGRLAAERQLDLVPGGAQLSGDPAADPSGAYDPDLQRPSSFDSTLTALAMRTDCASAFPRSA